MEYQKRHLQKSNKKNGWTKNQKWRKQRSKKNRYAETFKKMQEEYRLDAEAQVYWDGITPILEAFLTELEALGNPPGYNMITENFKYSVKFFDIVSRYQDELGGSIKIAPGKKQEIVKDFNNDLYFSGRHEPQDMRTDSSGMVYPYWNTTFPGTAITEETIMYGPDIGLPLKPVSYWLTLSKKKKIMVKECQRFAKGTIKHDKPVWASEAIAKICIQKFFPKAYECLTTELKTILA